MLCRFVNIISFLLKYLKFKTDLAKHTNVDEKVYKCKGITRLSDDL